MPYTAMPPWPSLSNADVTDLMYHIKTFSSDFSGPFGEVTALEIPSPPSMTDASIARGREVYLTNQCSDCHGNRGLGDGPSAPTLEDRWGYPIRAADMTKRWAFRGGGTREDIYQTFTTGLDGTPMPSFEISPPEDQWALVDYVYSLSRDEPNYATMVIAHATTGPIDLSQKSFTDIEPAYFPVVGQIMEPGRSFFPGVNGVNVRAVYNDEHIAIMLEWHDMSADTSGSNAPTLVPPGAFDADSDSMMVFSDAAAIQFPTVLSAGSEMPYFIFGDRKLSTDIWYSDLAASGATHYVGKGASNLSEEGPELAFSSSFEEGEWTVIFRRARNEEAHTVFDEGSFVPIAFSIWDGFSRERGNKRGLTSWSYLYMDVAVKESPVLPMMAYGFATLLLGLVVTFVTRKKVKGT
ncbi:MAG: c-type cytochrome [Bacteroidetes bacterium]|nr:MAG: c-type cytochrome [Bacteroidota bacterium]